MRITTKLTLGFLSVSLIPILIILLLGLYEVRNFLRKEALAKIYLAIEEKESQIEKFLATQLMNTRYLAQDSQVIHLTKKMILENGILNPAEQHQAYKALREYLTKFTDFHGGLVSEGGIYLDVMIADLKGYMWAGVYNPPDESGNEGDTEWFQQGRRALYLGNLGYNPAVLQTTQISAAPIKDENQTVIGVLQLETDISVLDRVINARIETIGKTARLYILGPDGDVLVKSRGKNVSAFNVGDMVERTRKEGRQIEGIYRGTGRDPAIFSVHPLLTDDRNIEDEEIREKVKGLGWVILGEIDSEEVFAPVKRFEYQLRFAGIMIALGVIVISIIQSYFFTQPIKKLRDAALSLGKGEDISAIDIQTKDEIGELAASFHQMARDIHGRTVSKDYVENIIKTMVEPLVVTDSNGGIVLVNEAFTKLLRYKLEEIKGKHIQMFFEENLPLLTGALVNKEASCRMKLHKSGIPVAVSSSKMVGRRGDAEGYVITIADRRIIELLMKKERDFARAAMIAAGREKAKAMELEKTSKDLEMAHDAGLNIMEDLEIARRSLEREKAELDEQKHALEKANLELDSFVYTASHDLKAPLRGISSFSSFLQERYKSRLDEKGVHYLERIVNGTKHMTKLIDDLLTLSRISRQKNPYEDVPVAGLIQSARERIEFDIEQKKVDLVIQKDLPVVRCDRIKMAEVFLNLINNAIKFSSKDNKENPRVEIGYQDAGEYHQFSVQDNGIGIEPRYHDQIFGIFKRLHTDSEYEGTGAGLSIVKRVIDDHHGAIRVDSDLGRGATFIFTIPKDIERKHKKIGEILVENGLISEEDLGDGLMRQERG
jgi:PAS domain S-box-containing protein